MSTLAAETSRLARARDAVTRSARLVEALPARRMIAVFIGVEWLAVLATGLVVRHAGWIYYQGGDQLWYYTLGWLLGHGQLTQTPVGYGWSLVLAPISRANPTSATTAARAATSRSTSEISEMSIFTMSGSSRTT